MSYKKRKKLKKSIVKIQKMDCPSEVKIIESLIEKISTDIKAEFDLDKRVDLPRFSRHEDVI